MSAHQSPRALTQKMSPKSTVKSSPNMRSSSPGGYSLSNEADVVYDATTVARVSATIAALELHPSRLRRLRAASALFVAAAVGSLGWCVSYVWLPPHTHAAMLGVVAVATLITLLAEPSWSTIYVPSIDVFHAPGLSRTITDRFVRKLECLGDPSRTPHPRSSDVPFPTSEAVLRHCQELSALDLSKMPATTAARGQFAPAVIAWVRRVYSDTADAAMMLAGTPAFRTKTIGEAAHAATIAVRATPPITAAPHPVSPWYMAMPRLRPAVTVAVAVCAMFLLIASTASMNMVLSGFSQRTYTSVSGVLDIEKTALPTMTSTMDKHVFVLDEKQHVIVVNDAGDVVKVAADNSPLDGSTGTLVSVAVSPDSIPVGPVDVYMTDDGSWTLDRANASFTQDRPYVEALPWLALTMCVALGLVVAACYRCLRDVIHAVATRRRAASNRY